MTGRGGGRGRWARLAAVRRLAGVLGAAGLLAACGSGPPSAAQSQRDIGHAYGTLFDFADHNVSAKTAVIEDGASLRRALTAALSSTLAQKAVGADVVHVHLLPASGCVDAALPSPCAEVTYNLLGAGRRPLFATPSTGYAVWQGGRWLVAKATICGLLELFYSASGRAGLPPGC